MQRDQLVLLPDDLTRRLVGRVLDVEIVVELLEEAHRVLDLHGLLTREDLRRALVVPDVLPDQLLAAQVHRPLHGVQVVHVVALLAVLGDGG